VPRCPDAIRCRARDPVSGSRGPSDPAQGRSRGPSDPAQGRSRGPSDRARDIVQDVILRQIIAALSGPGGIAARLRADLPGLAGAAASLPLDIGTTTRTVPPHLRRAVIARDRHCAFPGCDTPAPACQVHHIIPWSRGGPTALPNLLLLCSYHHLIAIHRHGWAITLHGDGTTTATSPDSTKTWHSHQPPITAGG
jgi:hypothetical protein